MLKIFHNLLIIRSVPLLVAFCRFFRVIPVVAVVTKADEVTVIECQLRIFIVVLDVVDGNSFSLSSVPLASLALIAVTSQDSCTFPFPGCGIVKVHNHTPYTDIPPIGVSGICIYHKGDIKYLAISTFGCRGWTRTSYLKVMSLASYQMLHSAI